MTPPITKARPRQAASVLAVVVCGLVVATQAAAQSLDHVEERTAAGELAEAREELMAWWNGPRAGANTGERQRALWLRGLLTLDPSQAELDYTRLVVEHPGGPYTDRALLRLARLAEFRGDAEAARRYYGVLARDYPRSPARDEARAWLSRPRPAASTEERVAEPAVGDHAVQLGAFSERSRADALAQTLRAAGREPRIVTVGGFGLIRVRLGRFESEEDALRLRNELRAAGFEAMTVTDATRERPAGGERPG
jgi:hypothetical protein